MSTQCCATPDVLARWLEGDLETLVARELDEHVEACCNCQAKLERLTTCRIAPVISAPLRDELKRLASSRPSLADFGDTENSGTNNSRPRAQSLEAAPRIPGYEMIRVLGRGGMGRVFLARHASLNRLVAVKVLSMELANSPQLVARLRAEAQSLAALKHPNVLQVFDVVETEGLPALILEYVADGSLSRKCDEQRPLPAEVCRIVEHIARGVHAAHRQGIIHRDLKPTNILMDGSTPKITDFGLALNAATGDRLTVTGDLFGTPEYMAPELIRDGVQNSSPQSDIYALGAILYELLTGHPPFCGRTVFQTMEMAANTAAVPPQTHSPEISDDLNRICLRALEKLPGKRFSSALEMADELASAAGTSSSRAITPECRIPTIVNDLGSPGRSEWRWDSVRFAVAGIMAISVVLVLVYSFSKAMRQRPADVQTADSIVPKENLFPQGSLWKGTFTFLPSTTGNSDGDMELLVEHRSGEDFEGTYYSGQRNYAWRIRGVIRGNEVWWSYVSALRDNDAGDVVGKAQVTGTIDGDRIVATWAQEDETARLDFLRSR